MQVWIMMSGERYEGGDVIGVYAEKNLAFTDFAEAAKRIDSTFGIDNITPAVDGSVHISGGCDWLSLAPYDVKTTAELTTR